MGFDTVLINVGMLFAFSIPGYIFRKSKLFGNTAVKTLVVLLIYAAQPAMVAKSFLSLKFSPEIGLNILFITLSFAFVMLTVFVIAALIFRKRKRAAEGAADEAEQKAAANNRLYRFAAMFGNTGYLGLPLIKALFPENNDAMILYTSLCIVVFNILTWTVGVYIITGDKKQISPKKFLLTPLLITAAVTIPFFFIKNLVTPAPVIKFFDSLGNMTTPLSMIIMGSRMAEMPFKEIFTDKKIYGVGALRLLLAPAIAFGILKLFGVGVNFGDADLYNTFIIISMMPSAAATIIFAEKFLPDSYTAIKAVLLTSLMCIVTIPLLCMFLLM